MRFLIALLIPFGSNASAKMLWGEDLLNHYIHLAARRHQVAPTFLRAIATVESRFGADRRVRLNSNGTMDVGPFQINSVHWYTTCKEYNIMNLKGNTLCAAKLLSMAKRYKNVDPYWQARYHSKTPSRKLAYWGKLKEVINGRR